MTESIKNRPRNFFPSASLQQALETSETNPNDTSVIKSDNSMFPLGKDMSFCTAPNEKDISTTKISLDLETNFKRHRPQSLLNEDTLKVIRKFYQLRAWSLIYPFLFTLVTMFNEMKINTRSLTFALISLIFIGSLAKIKCLEPKKNILLVVLISCCTILGLMDFLLQFSVIGNQGWKEISSYGFCFEGKVLEDSLEKMQTMFCTGFKIVYYLNGILYIPYILSLVTYLFATFRLLSLTSYEKKDAGFRFKLEDAMEEED